MLPKEFLSVGIDRLGVNKFIKIKNDPWVKPIGGFWSSKYEPSEQFKSPWLEWCSSEMPNWISGKGLVFSLKEDSKIFIVNKEENLKGYLLESEDEYYRFPDFELLSSQYDGMYVTEEYINEQAIIFPALRGWDVPSLLLFNLDCIANHYSIKF